MKNVWKVFRADAKRLSSNVVALVIIMGLAIIPALYAWFNIMSNWDPYGTSATSQMKIGVYSADEGFSYDDLYLCVGDKIVANLQENDTINWQFPESEEETLEGVYSGEYYAALIIPEDFTIDMLSFIGGDIDNPQILYYENSKKNAIATKITAKVKTTVQQSVNSSILSSLTEIASISGELLTGETSDGESVLVAATASLEEMDRNLETYASILTTLALLTDSAGDLVVSAQDILPSVEGMIDAGSDSITGMQGAILAGAQTAESIRMMVDISLSTVNNSLADLQKTIDAISVGMDMSDISANLDQTKALLDATIGILENYRRGDGGDFDQALDDTIKQYQALYDDIEQFQNDAEKTQEKLDSLKATLSTEIKACQDSITKLQTAFDYNIAPNLNQSVYNIETSLMQTQLMLNNLDDSFPLINVALDDYASVLESGTEGILETRDYVVELDEGLDVILDGMHALSNDEQYAEVVSLLQTDPALIASFVTSPISMETEAIYEIEEYGSAMAPFYTVLALWVGGLITVALIHVKVKDAPEIEGTSRVARFFGRYLIFLCIVEAQCLITVFGNLFFVGIQCPHPFLFWLAAATMSFMFSFFMYALTYAWGNIGQAIAVIIMVVQVAGAGGTFPIEVLPKAYQAVYKFLPFTYAMNALRECVGGLYRFDYLKDLGVLFLYILLSVPLGLFLGKPFVKLNAKLEESKKKSGVML